MRKKEKENKVLIGYWIFVVLKYMTGTRTGQYFANFRDTRVMCTTLRIQVHMSCIIIYIS